MTCALASEALVQWVASELLISSFFPFVLVGGKKVTGSTRVAIANHWGAIVVKTPFRNRHIINKYDFSIVLWDGMEWVLLNIPEMFCMWVTQQVLHFCGTNR